MPAESKQSRAQDRVKVAGGLEHEMRYEAEKTGASRDQVKEAVEDVGNSRRYVEQILAGSERKGPKRAASEHQWRGSSGRRESR